MLGSHPKNVVSPALRTNGRSPSYAHLDRS